MAVQLMQRPEMSIQAESSNMPAPVVTDLEFCPWCGSILPLISRLSDVVCCQRCQFKRSVKEYESSMEEFTIQFTEKKTEKTQVDIYEEKSDEELIGPTVERQCPRCNHDIMTYTTRQTRSADEGQTVFYTCIKCKFQDIEYS